MNKEYTLFVRPGTELLKVDFSPLHDKIAALEKELAAARDEKMALESKVATRERVIQRMAAQPPVFSPITFNTGAAITINGQPFNAAQGDAFEATMRHAYDTASGYTVVVRRL